MRRESRSFGAIKPIEPRAVARHVKPKQAAAFGRTHSAKEPLMSLPLNSGTPPNAIKEGSDAGFMADVIEASRHQPVMVDFWAPWCGPCRQLTPTLEKLVRAAQGKVRLVKINIDQNPAVAGQLGVQSIPAVFAFYQGRPIDGFMGALPESQLKTFIDRLLGAAAGAGGAGPNLDELVAHGNQSLEAGDLGGAAQAFAAVLQEDPEHLGAIGGLARCYLAGGEPDKAREVLEMAPEDKRADPAIRGVVAALDLAAGVPAGVNLQGLLERIALHPKDHAARFDLACSLAARGDLEKAVDHLLSIIEADRAWNDEAARIQLLKIFDAAGPASEIAKSGRRRLSAMLFS